MSHLDIFSLVTSVLSILYHFHFSCLKYKTDGHPIDH